MMYDENWLRRRAWQAAPFEACGFIFDDGSIVEIRNIATNPHSSFEMDLRQANQAIQGKIIHAIWHTHPSGKTYPSEGDIRAMNCGAIKPHWSYLIVTAGAVIKVPVKNFAPQEDSFWAAFSSSSRGLAI